MSQPLPSRQRKAWLPPSLRAVRYPATPTPSRASTTTIQSGRPFAVAPAVCTCTFLTLGIALLGVIPILADPGVLCPDYRIEPLLFTGCRPLTDGLVHPGAAEHPVRPLQLYCRHQGGGPWRISIGGSF